MEEVVEEFALERIQRGRMVGAKKVQQVYDLENVRYLPDRAKERRQRNAQADFIVASDQKFLGNSELSYFCIS